MNKKQLERIQARIGYKFNNADLLVAAFTHSSYINEHKATGNERIEFLGDCVLNFLVGERLYDQDPTADEGALSARRAALVSRAPLARIVDDLGILEFLQVGAGVDKSAFSDKARSDLFESIVGAVYKDGGAESCRKLLDNIFYGSVLPERDYKSELKQYADKLGMEVVYSISDEKTEEKFQAEVRIGTDRFYGVGVSKRNAERAAAESAVNKLIPNNK